MTPLVPRQMKDGRVLCGRVRCRGELPRQSFGLARLDGEGLMLNLDGWEFSGDGVLERTSHWHTDDVDRRRGRPPVPLGADGMAVLLPKTHGLAGERVVPLPVRIRCPNCQSVNEVASPDTLC